MKKTLKISLIVAAAVAVVSAVTISTNVLRASEVPDAQYVAEDAGSGAPEVVEYVEVAPAAPVVEAPVVEAPVVEAPAAEAPAAEAPAAEAPAAEAPAAEAPAAEAPAAEAPAEGATAEPEAETPAEGAETEAPADESAESEKPANAEKTEEEKTEEEKTEEEKTEEEKSEEEKSEEEKSEEEKDEEESEEDEEEDEEEKEKKKKAAAASQEISVVVMIMGNRVTTVYNGEEQIATGFNFTASVAGGELGGVYTANDFAFSGNAAVSGTDAGTYAMGLTPDMFVNVNPYFTNVTFVVVDGALTISPLPVALGTESGSWEYDGEAHSLPTVYGTEGFLGRDGMSVSADASVTEAGETVNAITVSGAGVMNYAITKAEGTLTVTPKPVALSTESGSWEYDGETHSLPTVTGSEGFLDRDGIVATADVTVTDAGEAANAITGSGAGIANYAITKAEGTLTVTPKPVTLSTESGSWPYDGEAHSLPTVAGVEAFLERDGIVATADATVTDVTDEEPVVNAITVTGEGLANYAITKNEGTLEITENEYYVSVTASIAPGSEVEEGDIITLSAVLSEGFEGKKVTYQWVVASEGGEWNNIPGATGAAYSFAATEESVACAYNVFVTIVE